MKYDELIKDLRYCGTHDCAGEAEELIGCMAMRSDRDCRNCNSALQLDAADAIEELQRNVEDWKATAAIEREAYWHWFDNYQRDVPKWIPVTEGLPKCEQEVLISTEKKLIGRDAYIDSIVTPAIYEDGTMRENDSIWRWEDVDWAGWDDEEDCGIIPEGWWENRHFNPDDVYNNPVDRKVVAWMPLPEPPKDSE